MCSPETTLFCEEILIRASDRARENGHVSPCRRCKVGRQLPCIGRNSAPCWFNHELNAINLYSSTGTTPDDGRRRPQKQLYDRHAVLNLIKLCGKEKNIVRARDIHADVLAQNLLAKDIYIATALITAYAKCGALREAKEVFEQIPVRDSVAWSALIGGYAQNNLGHEALQCFQDMQNMGISPNPVTYTHALKACGIVQSLEIGKDIEAKIRKEGLLNNDVVLGTALVAMYSKCGAMEKAQEVFELLPSRNVVSWSALIAGYAHNGLGGEALKCFLQMEDAGVPRDAVTYICALKACGIAGSLEIGERIHAEVRKQGLLQKDVVLGNALMDMYGKCGALEKARAMFEQLPKRNVVSWNALIVGYAQNGLGDEALICFKQMQNAGVCPDKVTYIGILKACGIVGSVEIGEDIDAEIRKQGLLEKDIMLGTALVDMYFKCGASERAQKIFAQLPKQNIVAWSALIAGYAQNGLGVEALECFRQMQNEGVYPNGVTYICILKACGVLGCLEAGEAIDRRVRMEGLLQEDIALGNALLDMYSKCGMLEKAREVFEQLPVRTVVSWSSLIAGYGQLGQAKRALEVYSRMKSEDIAPNSVTFVILLNSCSHAGFIREGENIFDEMRISHCVSPSLEHYTCMIDLFGRAGHFDKLQALLSAIPRPGHYLAFFRNILGSCRKWRNVKLGRWAFEKSMELDARCGAAYVCMRNIYATAGMQAEADRIEALRVKNKASKTEKCCWWAEADKNMHSFAVCEEGHPQARHIYKKLEEEIHPKLLKEGYAAGLSWSTYSFRRNEKKHMLCGHTEKLAIACALINSPEGMPIHVTKNTSMCGDCHWAVSLLSKIERRRIQVKSAKYVHMFEKGRCICDDYYS